MLVGIAVLVFIFTTSLVILIVQFVSRSGVDPERFQNLFPTRDQVQAGQRVTGATRTDMMPTLTRYMKGRPMTERLVTDLSSAGLPIRPSEFIGIVAGSVLFFELLAMLLFKSILGYFTLGAVGLAIPLLVLRHLRGKRRVLFERQIADALIMMASSLRSGFSFLRALQMVAQEMPPPIAKEFERVVNEVNVGRPMEDALRSVVTRVQSYDFDLVVTAVLIQQQVGGNLADILDTIAATMRDRSRVIGEINALTAEGRISGIVLVALPIFLGVVMTLLNPTYMHVLIYETLGHILLGIAAGLQIVGGLIIRRLLVLDI